jgi:hypothetical protein
MDRSTSSHVVQRRRALAVCCGLIFLHAVLLGWSAVRNSVTVDEYAHLPAGAVYWKYREFAIYNLSPSLLRFWAAAPVMLAGAQVPSAVNLRDEAPSSRHWLYAERFQDDNAARYQHLFVLARLGMIPISCWAAWVVFQWALTLYGPRGAIGACAMYCLDPNFIAHASLVTTDAGTAAATLTAAWLWWRFCRRNNSGALMFAAAFGIAAAVLCKFTGLLILPTVVLIGIAFVLHQRKFLRRLLLGMFVVIAVLFVSINFVYAYKRTFLPLSDYQFVSSSMQTAAKALPSWLPVPLPYSFVEGFDVQKWETDAGVPGYLLDQYYIGSRWYYYPITLLCKLPVISLLILGITILSFFVRRMRFHESMVLIAIVVFAWGTAVLGQMNIGIRHILPVLPFAYVLSGRVWRAMDRAMVTMLPVVLVLAIETISAGPNFLAFFNRAVGGAQRGQFILNDSNCDWGQGLIGLRDWLSKNSIGHVTMAYFGRVDPAMYGISATPLVNGQIDSDYVVVSSRFIAGLPYRMRRNADEFTPWMRLRDVPTWRALKPVAVVDDIMRIYRKRDVEPLMMDQTPLFVPATPTATTHTAAP